MSCGGPECKNNNLALDKLSSEMAEYKAELAKQIKISGTDNLSYYYDGYMKKDSLEYISIRIKGDSLCAKGELLVKDWTKLGDLRRNVSGFSGAELKGLKFEIEENTNPVNLIFLNVDEVID
jgi:hypothetical protein